MTFAEIIIGIITNVFSSYIYDKAKQHKDKKKTEAFIALLREWAIAFEHKHDGTVITTGDFYTYVKYQRVIETIFAYYGAANAPEMNETQFIDDQKMRLFNSLEKKSLNYNDKYAINEFFASLCEKSKIFFDELIPLEMRRMLFEVFQARANSEQALELLQEVLKSIYALQKDVKEQLYVLTENDLAYYGAWLTAYASNASRALYVDRPIEGYYDEVIFPLRRRFAELTWKQDVINIIDNEIDEHNNSGDTSTQLEKTLNFAKGRIEYEMIWELLVPLTHEKAFSNNQGESVFTRDFNKVALISGEPGSGKSHFLNELFRFNSPYDDSNIVFVPLNCEDLIRENPVTAASWENLLVRGVNNCLNTELQNFESLSCNENFRLVFVIDDIHKLHLHRVESFAQLMQTVKKHTKHDFVFWLFTINQFDLYLLENKNSILHNYIMKSERDYGLFKSTFNLTCHNEENTIGETIMALYNIELSPFSAEVDFQTDAVKPGFCSPLNNPFYAHILGISGITELLPHMTEYLDFIEELVRCLDLRLKTADESHYSSILSSIRSIALMSLSKSKISFTDSELGSVAGRNAVAVLREQGLLQRVGEINDIYSLKNLEEIYSLYISIYWVLKIVLSAHETTDSCTLAYSSMAKIIEYRDELLPFYLLFLDSNNFMDECSELFIALRRDKTFKYALFASVKSSISYRTKVLEFLKKDETVELSNAETFSLLCYAYYHNAKAHDKYYILNKYIDSIYRHGLQDSVELILNELLYNARTLENLKRNIKPLFGCGVQDANFMFGYQIGSKYYDLIKDEPIEKQINDMIYYLRDNYDAIKGYAQAPNATFIDFLIRAYFEHLITNQQIGLEKLYTALENRDVLYDRNIGYLIRRNLSCAAGNVYERTHLQGYKDEFCDLVGILISNGNIEDLKFAFHFISNSISNDNETSGNTIDFTLQSFLETIWKDKRLLDFCKMREDFFNRNLE